MQRIETKKKQMSKQYYKLAQGQVKPQNITKILK